MVDESSRNLEEKEQHKVREVFRADPESLRRWRRRLYLRRWLVVAATIVFMSYVIFFELPFNAAVAGVAVMSVAAGILPREGLLWRQRLPRDKRPVTSPAEGAMRKLIEGLSEPSIVLNVRGAVLFFNNKAKEAYPSLAAGRHISLCIRHPQLLDAIEHAGEQRPHQTVQVNEVVPVARNLSVSVSWIWQKEAGLRDPAIFMFLHDQTEQERIGQMRADFVANASHELRTPLSSVLGFIETLQGPARDDEKARDRFLAVMEREALRMKSLIEDLLSLSRVEMKAHILPTAPVEVGEVIDYVKVALEPLAAERGITLEVDGFYEKRYVLGDRAELVQVFQNLVHNAVKYGREGGRVQIRMEKKKTNDGPSEVVISVKDDGVGIAKEHLPRLTERFYRVNVTASRDQGGTGLGLSIVKHVLNRHRGQLRIASELGEGSTFTVVLPEVS